MKKRLLVFSAILLGPGIAHSDSSVFPSKCLQEASIDADGAGDCIMLSSDTPQAPDSMADPGAAVAERVGFASGAKHAELNGRLLPGASRRYLIDGRKGQELTVRVDHLSGSRMLDLTIFQPDGSLLTDMAPTGQPYSGHFVLSGDHVVEVINHGNRDAEYVINFFIDSVKK